MKPRISTGALCASLVASTLCSISCSDRADHPQNNSGVPFAIEPNVAVGPVHAGMRVQELVAKLGEPERRTANSLEYTRRGFAVMPGPDGTVHVIMCGDVTGISGPLVKAFTGRTKEGIGLGSTREDLVKTYGEPTSSERFRGGTESIRYDPLGITFTLEAGKIYHMIIRLQGAREPDRTVSLEP
ncbi:MAG TPA: hypothetical protein VLT36_08115 [Candidatus Dormibacteraeota bacterium]|nr:hypothetical protein [Candidatus Dormibacteraeota bacterium]